jgi:lipoprotein-anchoring transpeptidase ErfK/SrfK
MRSLLPLVLAAAFLSGCANTPETAGRARPELAPAGRKHVEIDKSTQTLRAWNGNQLFLQSRVSTGKIGKRTPNGLYHADYKERMHYSRLYDDAPMPFSVHVGGNYFIHGYSSVPRSPASHGCIRLPLTNGNPARRFYEWVEPGTPVRITGHWQSE